MLDLIVEYIRFVDIPASLTCAFVQTTFFIIAGVVACDPHLYPRPSTLEELVFALSCRILLAGYCKLQISEHSSTDTMQSYIYTELGREMAFSLRIT